MFRRHFCVLKVCFLVSLFIGEGLVAQGGGIGSPPGDPHDNSEPYGFWSSHTLTANAVDGDLITIPDGLTLYLDVDTPRLKGLIVDGALVFQTCPAMDLTLQAGFILVRGSLTVGAPDDRFPAEGEIRLIDPGSISNADFPGEYHGTPIGEAILDRGLVVTGTGSLFLYGADQGKTWTTLSSTIFGENSSSPTVGPISVQDDVSGWLMGDEVVIASTDFSLEQAEKFSLVANASGAQLDLGLVSPGNLLQYDHYAGMVNLDGADDSWRIPEYAEVGLLSRNVLVIGEPGNGYDATGSPVAGWDNHYGHMIALKDPAVSGTPTVHVSWTRFENLGVEGKIARYPLHLHLLDEENFASGVDALIEDSSFVDCFNHFVSVHQTKDIAVARNVGFNTLGHGFFLEEEFTTGILLQDNLGLGVRPFEVCHTPYKDCNDPPGTFPSGIDLIQEDNVEPSVFWFEHPDNKVEGNRAAGSTHHGIWHSPAWLEDHTHQATEDSYCRNNVVHSNGHHGFMQDGFKGTRRASPAWEAGLPPSLENLISYKNGRYGVWYRTYGRAQLRYIKVADSRAGFYLASEGIHNFPGLSLILLEDALVVGESALTENPGNGQYPYPGRPVHEEDAERSLPQNTIQFVRDGIPHDQEWDTLVGVEFYDGRIECKNLKFADLKDLPDLRDPEDGPLYLSSYDRPAAALSQVGYDSNYSEDPTNRVQGLAFENVDHKVWFREIQKTANMVQSTVIIDYDDSLGNGPARFYFPEGTDFLVHPTVSSLVQSHSADQAVSISATETDFANLMIRVEDLDGVNGSPVDEPSFAGIDFPGGPTPARQRLASVPDVGTQEGDKNKFSTNLMLSETGGAPFEYMVDWDLSHANTNIWPTELSIILRAADEENGTVIIGLPMENAPDINSGVSFGGTPVVHLKVGLVLGTLADLRGTSDARAWIYDSNLKYIFIKMTSDSSELPNYQGGNHVLGYLPTWSGTFNTCHIDS
ncbi:MAG: hypothetical protein DWQ01_15010 [Planctomycetota bacterium]|nr:MAG: hypothetical protein DWQ01_15010 [Planctomycetota bacterium]